MEASTKIVAAVAGVAVIGAFMMLRSGGSSGGSSAPAPTGVNVAAMNLATANAENAAQIAINRDQITGATNIQALKSLGVITQYNTQMTSELAETNASISRAQINARTAEHIEASRASVAKTVAEYQYKIAKKSAKGSNLNSILGAVNGTLKIGASVLKDIF